MYGLEQGLDFSIAKSKYESVISKSESGRTGLEYCKSAKWYDVAAAGRTQGVV